MRVAAGDLACCEQKALILILLGTPAVTGRKNDARITVRSTFRHGHDSDRQFRFGKIGLKHSCHVDCIEHWAWKHFPAHEIALRLTESSNEKRSARSHQPDDPPHVGPPDVEIGCGQDLRSKHSTQYHNIRAHPPAVGHCVHRRPAASWFWCGQAVRDYQCPMAWDA